MSGPGLYQPGDSWLYRLDPRVKLLMTSLGVLGVVLGARILDLVLIAVLAQAILLLGRVPARRLWSAWRALLPVILVVLILQPLLAPGPGPDLFRLGPIRLTEAGLLLALHYALRVIAAAFASLIPTLTTPLRTLVRALERLGLPFAWSMLIGLAVQYVGSVGALYEQIRAAQMARGLDLESGGLAQRMRSALPSLVALAIQSLRLSDGLAIGMAARGYGMRVRRTTLHELSMRPHDWLWLAGLLLGFGAYLLSLVG